tara:strand:+ start:290 stop:571 length:282 start_codon:yes stop_codon:yes gene_type:complete
MAKQQQIHDCFDVELYEEGGEVFGPVFNEVCKLNSTELFIYDSVLGSATLLALGINNDEETKRKVELGLEWFKENNIKAYQILMESIEHSKNI